MKRKIRRTAPKRGYSDSASQKEIILSVITPAYNAERSLSTCLESVLAQKGTFFEIIVVENGSKDSTREIIQTYAQAHAEIKPIYLDKNCGPAGARNLALDQARGKYIAFCDSDDQVPEGAYEELVRVAELKNADIVTGNYSRKYPMEHNAIRQFSRYQAPTGFERCFEAGNTTLWNKLFRRSFLEKHQLRFDTKLLYHEDFHLYLRFMLNDPVAAFTDTSVYIYTEPAMRTDINHEESIRYARLEVIQASMYVCKDVFRQPIRSHVDLWGECLYHHVNWLVQYVWRNIMEADERKAGFEEIQKTLCALQETTSNCDWTTGHHMERFIEIFGVDFYTFASMSYDEYIYIFCQRQGICPRAADHVIVRKLGRLSRAERDQALTLGVEQIMEDIRGTYKHEIVAAKPTWKSHYYNLLDSALNDYWRQISSQELRKELYEQLQNFICEMRTKNSLCAISAEADISRFQQIFCVDYAAFQVLDCSRYMLLCATNACGRSGSGGTCGTYYASPQPLEYYVSSCRNGQIGMRGILKGITAWLKYKLHR